MAGETIGLNAKLYVADGSIGSSPTWIEADVASDVTVNDEANMATIKDRRSRYEKRLVGLRALSIDATLTSVKGDSAIHLIRSCYKQGLDIAVAVMTGDIDGSNEEGILVDCKVSSMTSSQPLEDGMTIDCTFEISADSAYDPTFVAGSGTGST